MTGQNASSKGPQRKFLLLPLSQVYTYCFFSLVVSTFIYPVVTHWIWSKAGFLSAFNSGPGRIGTNGVIDFAGAGAVHLTGTLFPLHLAVV